jgi:hypothetical protein
MAVDSNGNALEYVRGSWSQPKLADPGGDLDAVSCPTSSFCMTTDGTVALSYSRGVWSSPTTIDPLSNNALGFKEGNEVSSISCPSSMDCVAVDNSGYEMRYEPPESESTSS